jgi:hypothetical protein
MCQARASIKLGNKLCNVAIDLGDVKYMKSPRNQAAARKSVMVDLRLGIVIARRQRLPQHHRRRALALANLRAGGDPLAVGSPLAAGIAALLGGRPQHQNVAAPIGPASDGVCGRPDAAGTVPRHAVIPCPFLDRRDDLRRDLLEKCCHEPPLSECGSSNKARSCRRAGRVATPTRSRPRAFWVSRGSAGRPLRLHPGTYRRPSAHP